MAIYSLVRPLRYALLLCAPVTFDNKKIYFAHVHLVKEQSTWTKIKEMINITVIPIVQ